jgi:hypothetical protein
MKILPHHSLNQALNLKNICIASLESFPSTQMKIEKKGDQQYPAVKNTRISTNL